jgi:hypothetical protein
VRHHHHFRAASATAEAIGESLAGTLQTIVRGQIDAIAQLRRSGIARRGDAQDFRQSLSCPRQVIRTARLRQQGHAFIAQTRDARAPDRLHAFSPDIERADPRPHRACFREPAFGDLEVALLGRNLRAPDQPALDRGDALRRPRLAGFQGQRLLEQRQRALARFAQTAIGQRPLGRFIQFPQTIGMVDPNEILRTALHPLDADAAHHRTDRMRTAQRLRVIAGIRQGVLAGLGQPRQRAAQPGLRFGIVGVIRDQREIQRNRGLCIFVKPAFGERGGGTFARGRNVGLIQRDLRAAPGQAFGDGVVAADRDRPIGLSSRRLALFRDRRLAAIPIAGAQQNQRRDDACRQCLSCRAQRQSPLRMGCSCAAVTLSHQRTDQSHRTMTRTALRLA